MKKALLFFLPLFFALHIQLFGQDDDITLRNDGKRLELKLERSRTECNMVPLGDMGFLLIYVEAPLNADSNKLQIIRYGTDMKEEYRSILGIPRGYNYVKHGFSEDNHVVLLFANVYIYDSGYELKEGYSFRHFELMDFNYATREYSKVSGCPPKGGKGLFTLLDFKVDQGKVYISGRQTYIAVVVSTVKGLVMMIDMKTRQQKNIEIKYKGGFAWILQANLGDTREKEFLAVKYYKRNSFRGFVKPKVILKTNLEGEFDKETQVASEPGDDIGRINVKVESGSKKFIIGLYNNESGPVSLSGLLISRYDLDSQVFVKKIPLKQLKSHTAWIEKDKTENKDSTKKKNKEQPINIRLLFHNLIDNGDEYLLIVESYRPEFQYYTSSPAGASYQTTSHIFTGNRFINMVVLGINKEDGSLKWEQSLPFNTPKQFILKRQLNVSATDSGMLHMWYYNGNGIQAISMKRDSIIAQEETKVDLIYEGKRSSQVLTSEASYWYKNYYLVYGVDRNFGVEKKADERVFYVQKVLF